MTLDWQWLASITERFFEALEAGDLDTAKDIATYVADAGFHRESATMWAKINQRVSA